MRITTDTEACVGAGQCVLAAADVFDQRDDDGVMVLLQAEPAEDSHGRVREAALLCPAGAIHVNE